MNNSGKKMSVFITLFIQYFILNTIGTVLIFIFILILYKINYNAIRIGEVDNFKKNIGILVIILYPLKDILSFYLSIIFKYKRIRTIILNEKNSSDF